MSRFPFDSGPRAAAALVVAGSALGGLPSAAPAAADPSPPCSGTPAVLPAAPVAGFPMRLDLAGSAHREDDDDPNPFVDVRVDLDLVPPGGGDPLRVPMFFAGDGAGFGGDATASPCTWRARLLPEVAGTWAWTVRHRTGPAVAASLDPAAGAPGCLDGLAGSFDVAAPDPALDAPVGHLGRGKLRWSGGHHLAFADGTVFVKGGADSPENWLGYEGFDGTPNARHDFLSHVRDWNDGDPDWPRTDPPGTQSGRAIIGAMNYLAEQGINSIYFLPMNVGGDAKDTWPWIGPLDRFGDPGNDNLHYDVSKLHQWHVALAHAQRVGLKLHFVLNEAEAPNKRELDDAELGVERTIFYREMIARFGHFPAVTWNLCEEYNLGLNLGVEKVFDFGTRFRALDPWGSPVSVHNTGNPRNTWDDFAGADANAPDENPIDLTSLQYANRIDGLGVEVEWFRDLTAAGDRPIPIMIDEPEGIDDVGSADGVRRRMLWDVLLSGGGVEWFVRTQDQSLEDFRTYEDVWRQTGIARRFCDTLPWAQMLPQDDRVNGASGLHGGPEVLALEGIAYAVFLPEAQPAATLDLGAATGAFRQRWFDPRTGAYAGPPIVHDGPGPVDLGLPPADPGDDWVVRVDALPGACLGDADGDGAVGLGDLLVLLADWGDCPPGGAPCPGDVDGDRDADTDDLIRILTAWGPCA